MSLRIGVLTSLYPAPETPFEGIFAARKWERMVARGHDVHVIAPLPWAPRAAAALLPGHYARMARAPKSEVRGGVPVARPRYLHVPSRSVGNARRFAHVGAHHVVGTPLFRPEVVVCDYAWPAAAAVSAIARTGIPVVVNGRGSDVLQVMGIDSLAPILTDGLRAASALTAVSQDLLDAMAKLRGDAEATALTPNGVDADTFRPGPRGAARATVGQQADGAVVLVVGHLIERKDPLLSLEAFHAAAIDGARLVFVGRGPLEGAVRERAAALGIADRVELVGERDPSELGDWYRAADVLLLTSSREGRPNVVLEALASGRPVLATDAGGTAEVVPDERMLATDRDAEHIGRKLADLVVSPPTEDELVESVRSLTWDASLDALESVLYEAVGAHRRASA